MEGGAGAELHEGVVLGTSGVTIQNAKVDEIVDLGSWYELAGASASGTLGDEFAQARSEGLLSAALRGGMKRAMSISQYGNMFESIAARTLVLSARLEGRTVGMAMLGPNPRLLQRGPQHNSLNVGVLLHLAKLHFIAVVPEQRQAGIGSNVLAIAAAIASQSAYRELYGEFHADRTYLESFYRRKGFTVLEHRHDLDVSHVVGGPMFIRPTKHDRLFTKSLT